VLTRPPAVARWAGGAAAALAVPALVLGGLLVTSADAAEPVDCPPGQTVCTVRADSPAHRGHVHAARTATLSATPSCRIPEPRPDAGAAVPCNVPGVGWWNNADGCRYLLLDPQPPLSDPIWQGHTGGAVYDMTCTGVPGPWTTSAWRAGTPAGGAVDPAVAAQVAVRALALQGPAIRTAPPAGAIGLVHVPVWLWTEVTPTTWGPASATAAVPGVTVTAVARAVAIRWDVGDGHVVTCHGPGTPYRPDLGTTVSPTCGHMYDRASTGRPGDAYPVTAETTWQVTWTGGGQSGALTVTRTSRTSVRIGEMQALT